MSSCNRENTPVEPNLNPHGTKINAWRMSATLVLSIEISLSALVVIECEHTI